MNQREVVILSGVRTAIGAFGGGFKNSSVVDLAGEVVREAVVRAEIPSTDIEHCVIGNVVHTNRSDMYVSRVAALNGGLSMYTPSLTVNRLCGSGLQSIISAAQLILLGDCSAVVAGGAEVMSAAPYWLPKLRFGQRMGDDVVTDPMTGALTCPITNVHMGITAENIAQKWKISRESQDAFALESHKRAAYAEGEGRFGDQILPIEVRNGKRRSIFDKDEHIRVDLSMDDLAKLRPAFKDGGTVTAGNSSGINDAAAGVVLMDREIAEKRGLKPMARLLAYSFAAVDPSYMGIGPVPAVKQLLVNAKLKMSDIDLWEINEAFASQALAVIQELNLHDSLVNPNGSGISLGHPIGGTGAILTVKALYELQRIRGRYAVITMCIGGGQGIAMLIERV